MRDLIFFSYSHRDDKWLQVFLEVLQPLIRKNQIKIWNDKQITPGMKWRDEIKDALQKAKVAVLLITPSFLASDFIAWEELPELLRASEEEGLTILPVIVSASLYRYSSIAEYQAANDPMIPLDAIPKSRRNAKVVEICEKIATAFRSNEKPFVDRTTDTVHPLQMRDPSRFQLALSQDPKTLEVETEKSRRLDEYDWMEFFAEAWTRREPGNSRAYEDLAIALLRSEQPHKAIEVGGKLVNLSRINYFGYQTIGRAYNKLGEWIKAQFYLELALNYAPPIFRQFVLEDMFDMFQGRGLVDNAIEILEELVILVNDDRRSYFEGRLAEFKRIRGK